MSSTPPPDQKKKTNPDKFGKLVVKLKPSQPLFIGDDIAIMYNKHTDNQISLLVIAPRDIKIKR
jgi:hypothetical protein